METNTKVILGTMIGVLLIFLVGEMAIILTHNLSIDTHKYVWLGMLIAGLIMNIICLYYKPVITKPWILFQSFALGFTVVCGQFDWTNHPEFIDLLLVSTAIVAAIMISVLFIITRLPKKKQEKMY